MPPSGPYPARAHARKVADLLHKTIGTPTAGELHVVYFAGEKVLYRHDTDRELLFRQESNFFYLSGCDRPHSELLLTLETGNPKLALFVPPRDPLDVMWSGEPVSLEQVRATHDADVIEETSSLSSYLASSIASAAKVVVHTLPGPLPQVFSSLDAGVNVEHDSSETFIRALHEARITKDEYEIELMREANRISSVAHETVMLMLGEQAKKGDIVGRKGRGKRILLPADWELEGEADVEAVFTATCRREGSLNQAYLPICASGHHAATLHYCCGSSDFACGPVAPRTDDKFETAHEEDHAGCHTADDGGKKLLPQVILIDAGCEFRNYSADVTRTLPVGNGGRFTPEARDIYSLVLDMHTQAFQACRPGKHWEEVHFLCHEILVRHFLELGIFKGKYEEVLASGISAAFFPHGLGHSLGMDVHDVPLASLPEGRGEAPFFTYLRLRRPLEEGMIVTVEPGCYFSPHLMAPVLDSPFLDRTVLAKYEGMGGVRIEDGVVITKDGAENLTTVRKDIEWLETICGGRE